MHTIDIRKFNKTPPDLRRQKYIGFFRRADRSVDVFEPGEEKEWESYQSKIGDIVAAERPRLDLDESFSVTGPAGLEVVGVAGEESAEAPAGLDEETPDGEKVKAIFDEIKSDGRRVFSNRQITDIFKYLSLGGDIRNF